MQKYKKYSLEKNICPMQKTLTWN